MAAPVIFADAGFSVEELWSEVYIVLAQSLRDSEEFKQWLLDATSKCPRLELGPYWSRRSWSPTHHAVRLAEHHRDSVAHTVGMMLLIDLPAYGTQRFAFPRSVDRVKEYRTVLADGLPDGEWFPPDQCLIHQHGLINCSFIFRRDRYNTPNNTVRENGLLPHSLLSARPLYCSDVHAVRGVQLPLGAQSVATEEEDAVGMGSLLCLPCGTTAPACAAIALYSPVPNAFGERDPTDLFGETARTDLFECKLPSWVEKVAKTCQLPLIVKLLAGVDDAYRSGLSSLAARILYIVNNKLTTLTNGLADLASIIDQLDPTVAIDSNRKSALSGLRETIGTHLDDPHHKTLQWIQDIERKHTSRFIVELHERDLSAIYTYIHTVHHDLTGDCSRDCRLDCPTWHNEPQRNWHIASYIPKDSALDVIVTFLSACLNNAGRYSNDLVTLEHHVSSEAIEFKITNSVPYTEHTLRRYWTVRQGHAATPRDHALDQEGCGGLQLYLLQRLAQHLGIDFLVEIPPPRPGTQLSTARWTCKIRARRGDA
jgi:hypothetical protein